MLPEQFLQRSLHQQIIDELVTQANHKKIQVRAFLYSLKNCQNVRCNAYISEVKNISLADSMHHQLGNATLTATLYKLIKSSAIERFTVKEHLVKYDTSEKRMTDAKLFTRRKQL